MTLLTRAGAVAGAQRCVGVLVLPQKRAKCQSGGPRALVWLGAVTKAARQCFDMIACAAYVISLDSLTDSTAPSCRRPRVERGVNRRVALRALIHDRGRIYRI